MGFRKNYPDFFPGVGIVHEKAVPGEVRSVPKQRKGCERVEVQMPPELLAAVDARAAGEPRNVWILRVLAKAAGVKLPADQLTPRRGRPRNPV